ncbi:ATP-binding protein [Lewinella sp. LCG006]|uniref:ATP-binding protein n=1 Tax=Lewinella sp. LCG006 TaxID=3231911 RepID=UPI00345F78FF
MNELLKNYNSHGNFLREKYFIQAFDCLPSKHFLELQLDDKEENLKTLLELLHASERKLELIFKIWKNQDEEETEEKGDFPRQHFFKSASDDFCIWISLDYERLYIEALYNHLDQKLETWIRGYFEEIKRKFSQKKTAVFKVLSKSGFDYYTEDISISEITLDINAHYNDDFLPIHEVIQASLNVDSSGLILLHGAPGTGKTSYIKYLLSKQGKRNFIFIPNDFVSELLQPNFVSFLISNKNSILVIEDAEKVIISRDSNSENSVVSTILQLTDGLFSDFLNIKIICTFNTSIDKVDKALLRKGRMIAYYEFKALTSNKANTLLSALGHETGNKAMTLAEIFNIDKIDFERNTMSNAIGFKK